MAVLHCRPAPTRQECTQLPPKCTPQMNSTCHRGPGGGTNLYCCVVYALGRDSYLRTTARTAETQKLSGACAGQGIVLSVHEKDEPLACVKSDCMASHAYAVDHPTQLTMYLKSSLVLSITRTLVVLLCAAQICRSKSNFQNVPMGGRGMLSKNLKPCGNICSSLSAAALTIRACSSTAAARAWSLLLYQSSSCCHAISAA